MNIRKIGADLFDPGANLYLIHPISSFILGTLATEYGNSLMAGMFLTTFAITILPIPNARRKKKQERLERLGIVSTEEDSGQNAPSSADNEEAWDDAMQDPGDEFVDRFGDDFWEEAEHPQDD